MSGPFRFGPDELGPTEGSELDDALEAISALELAADEVPTTPGSVFTDRVMAALADAPSPAPMGFLLPMRRRGLLAGFSQSVRQAWASIGAGRPAFARAAALAYVLVVAVTGISVAGAATLGAAGALGLLGPQVTSPEPTQAPEISPVPTPQTPPPSSAPTPSPTPSESPDDHGGGSGGEPSDDHGDGSGGSSGSDDGSGGSGGSGPSATDDNGGSDDESGFGGGSDSSATATPRPTGTPKPSETPH